MMSKDPAPPDAREPSSDGDDNPFKAPATPEVDDPATSVEKPRGGAPFALQAVRFSLYAPVLLLATNLIVRESLGVHHPGTKGFAIVSLLTIAAAFFLGIMGMFGSLKRWSFWSAFLGLLGTLLNGGILAGTLNLLK